VSGASGSDAIERYGLAAAVEQAADGTVITDTEGINQYVSPAFTALTGYTREEYLGRTREFSDRDNNPRRFMRISGALSGPGGSGKAN